MAPDWWVGDACLWQATVSTSSRHSVHYLKPSCQQERHGVNETRCLPSNTYVFDAETVLIALHRFSPIAILARRLFVEQIFA